MFIVLNILMSFQSHGIYLKVEHTSKLTTILFLLIVFVGACSVRTKENCYCGHGKSQNKVKDAFEIANESDIVLQLYNKEWIIVN